LDEQLSAELPNILQKYCVNLAGQAFVRTKNGAPTYSRNDHLGQRE
jgi:hypothetical protein